MPQDAAPTKINQAIRECLNLCHGSKTPLACLAAFCTHLETNSDWNERDIRSVESRVLGVLRGIVTAD
jgi:hypothetical protein